MNADGEQVAHRWERDRGDGVEQVLVLRNGRSWRVRHVGPVTAPDMPATNEIHALQIATRLMVREWRRTPVGS